MAYNINKTNGELLLTLEDGRLNTETSVGLLGKNTIGYGEVQNENFVHLLENFAGKAPPAGRSLTGQIYFNTDTNQLNVYDGTNWNLLGNAVVSGTAPSTTTSGAVWLKTSTQQLYVYNNGWQLIGPEAVQGFGATQAKAVALIDTADVSHAVIELIANGVVLAICSSDLFTIKSTNAVTGFSVIKPGITISSDVNFKGNLDGNSLTASTLRTPRKINGVDFDGSQDITVTATAAAGLLRGAYLTGSDFDGSANVTWAVDAATESNPNKVVVRDANGDFAARKISANLIGNVQGNITSLGGVSSLDQVVANKISALLQGNVIGNATSATKLETSRKINGINFDGTGNITVTANTNLPLYPGQHLIGGEFDGSVNRTWDVLATSANEMSKIVARDSNGNFNAGTITANFVGNLTGNVTASTGISTFSTVNATTFAGTLVGNATGNAGSANRLLIDRFINGVAFNGTTSITIKAETPNPHVRGAYLTGDNFTGASAVSWAVDATPDNVANKVVARNANGDLAARIVYASLSGNVTGNVTGNLSGNVTGNVTGGASANIYRSGDAMTGYLTLAANPVAGLHAATKQYVDSSIGNITNYDEFQAYVKSPGPQAFPHRTIRGFSAYSNTDFPGNYFGGITVTGPSAVYSGQIGFNWNSEESAPSGLYFRVNDDTSNTSEWSPWTRVATAGDSDSRISRYGDTMSGDLNLARDPVNGAHAATKNYVDWANGQQVAKSGDSMSGYLTLVGAPASPNHAATKDYVDARTAAQYTFTYGQTSSQSGYTNQVNSWNFSRNWFDIYPPAGKTIYNLVAFIPSIAIIHFAGGVNGDDSLLCTYTYYYSGAGRIRVYVQNTEQRSTPAANWLCVWR